MQVVNVLQAKSTLSTIDTHNEEVARLKPYQPSRGKIAPPGGMKGKIRMSPDFDEPIDELFDCLKDGGETLV